MKKTAVFISGNGSNLQALIDQWLQGGVEYDLSIVISNIADVKGIERAKKAGITTIVIDHTDFASREDFDQALDQTLREHQIEIVALAGFMRLLSDWFVKKWAGALINIHPSLLPAFPGLHTHKKALAYGVKYSGCSVFFVDEGVDTGAIIDQEIVEIFPEDTEKDLAIRVLKKEHLIFPKALDDLAQGKVSLNAGKVIRSR